MVLNVMSIETIQRLDGGGIHGDDGLFLAWGGVIKTESSRDNLDIKLCS